MTPLKNLSTKLCVDCKYFIPHNQKFGSNNYARCGAAPKIEFFIDGTLDPENFSFCCVERAFGCGITAKNFQSLQIPPVTINQDPLVIEGPKKPSIFEFFKQSFKKESK